MIEKGQYGSKDQRCNLYKIEKFAPMISNQVKKQAESVACLVDKSHLVKRIEGGYQLVEAKLYQRKYNLDENAKFREEPVVNGWGTAFLIGKQLALTAAHCVCHKNTSILNQRLIENMRLVFGFQMFDKKVHKDKFEKNDVYRIRNIVAHQLEKSDNGKWYDWAVLRVDRDVENRVPLNFTFKGTLATEEAVYMLGHPHGLPMKWVRDAEIQKNDGEHYFEADLDAYKGNSGSPVFLEETQELVGMLVAGNGDFLPGRDSEGALKDYINKVSKEEIAKYGYEKCQKVISLFFLKAVLSSINLPSSPIQRVARGLSLEVTCDCDEEIKSISRGFGQFNISKEYATAICPSCKTNVPPDNVKVIVLSSCQYQVEGQNAQNQQINSGPFSLLKGPDKIVRFNLKGWHYLEFDIKELK